MQMTGEVIFGLRRENGCQEAPEGVIPSILGGVLSPGMRQAPWGLFQHSTREGEVEFGSSHSLHLCRRRLRDRDQ